MSEFKQKFNGSMWLPLDGGDIKDFMSKVKFTGHWATRRYQIMKKPRRYRINIYVYNKAGDKEHDVAQMLDAGNEEHLWETICTLAQQVIDKYPEEELDAVKSCAVVRA